MLEEQENIQELLEFEVPDNLYIPTPPLWIESKGFRGPLDLLWYLIREQDIDILDIPVALIAAQYVQYIKLMEAYRFEIAPDYLVMAVRLMQIKSQMLLPKPPIEESEENDPRAFLVQQLTEYVEIQKIAYAIEHLPRWERDIWPIKVVANIGSIPVSEPQISLETLGEVYNTFLKNQIFHQKFEVLRPLFTLSERMQVILEKLNPHQPKDFTDILEPDSSLLDIAISFQASLELAKINQIELEQNGWHESLWLNRLT